MPLHHLTGRGPIRSRLPATRQPSTSEYFRVEISQAQLVSCRGMRRYGARVQHSAVALPRRTDRSKLPLGHERHAFQSVEVSILGPDVSSVHTCGRQNDAVSHGKTCLQAQVGSEQGQSAR